MDEKGISRRRLIRLGAVLGLGSVGAPMATGCGADVGSSETQASPTADAPEVGKGQAIAKESEVGPGSAFPFTDTETGQQGVLVHLENGEFAAYSAVCTHQACTVAYRPEEKKLACPCHGSVFDPARGAAVENGPANSPLPEVEIEVRAGEVFLA